MIAIGYARVSSKGQAERGLSISAQAQAQAVEAYCQLYGLELMEIIQDKGLSAKTVKNRPGMLTLLDRIREREADAVVVYKLDRMFRTIRGALAVLDEFKARGVAFHSVVEKWDIGTAIGEFAMNMVMAVAQLERKQIGERTRMVLRETKQVTRDDTPILASRKKRGKLLVGTPPYGYRWVRKNLVPHPQEMALVKRILAMHRVGMGKKKIAKVLIGEMLKNRRGDFFDPTQIRRIINADYYGDQDGAENTIREGVNS